MADNKENLADISSRIQSRRRRFTQVNLLLLFLFLVIMGGALMYGFQKSSRIQELDNELATTSEELETIAEAQNAVQGRVEDLDQLQFEIEENLTNDVIPRIIEDLGDGEVSNVNPPRPSPRPDSFLINSVIAELGEAGYIGNKALSRLVITQDSLLDEGIKNRQRIRDYEAELNRLQALVDQQQATIRSLEATAVRSLQPVSTTRILSERAGIAFDELGMVVTVGRFSSKSIKNVNIYSLENEALLFSSDVALDTDVSFQSPTNDACTHVMRVRRITRIPLFKDQMQVVIQTRC